MRKLISKYVKQMQRNTLFMYPSEINYLEEDGFELNEELMLELDKRFQHLDSNQLPKLQVAQKNGQWFALNNTILSLMRNLEKQNRCEKVQVEVVPNRKVPNHLQRKMISKFEKSCGDDDQATVGSFTSSRSSRTSSTSSCCSLCLNSTITTTISNGNYLDGDGNGLAGHRNHCCATNAQKLNSTTSVETFGSQEFLDNEDDDVDNKTCLINNSNSQQTEDLHSSASGCDDTDTLGNANSSCGTITDYSDFDDDENLSEIEEDDSFVCNVCDKNFSTSKLLVKHQLKKKHFGCPSCKEVFTNSQKLEFHKHKFKHWSEEDSIMSPI